MTMYMEDCLWDGRINRAARINLAVPAIRPSFLIAHLTNQIFSSNPRDQHRRTVLFLSYDAGYDMRDEESRDRVNNAAQ
jgi:hypothetical protein